MRKKIVFYLNGKRKEVGSLEGSMMLAEYLRYDQHLTGTKIVCAEGDCGSCSVLRYFPHAEGVDAQNYLTINSCISLVAQLDGSSLVTVDALKEKDQLHESQRAMIQCHGSQCGFCTPGFVMALAGLVEEKICKKETKIEVQEAKNCMTGNLCRCTGYQPIIDAALDMDLTKQKSIKERFYSAKQSDDLKETYSESVLIEGEDFSFFAPKTLKEALDFLNANPDARIMGSSTDLGVIHNKRKIKLTKLLSLHLIPELYKMSVTGDEVSIGSRVTFTEFRHLIKKQIPEIASYLDIFASPQIKNIATVVGNVANASPIGDTPPALLALNATIMIASPAGAKELPIHELFVAYRKINIKADELITGIKFKIPSKSADFKLYKNSNRKDMDISAVNLGIKVEWKDDSKKEIKDITIAAGGIAATPLRLKKTETWLKTNKFNIDLAVKELHAEFNPLSDVRASSAYRHVLVENYFRKFFAECGGVQ